MNKQLYIADPCHEDWNKMQINEEGRHCVHCCKTVIDFTTWDTEAILQYLRENKQTCGRLRSSQLSALPEGTRLEVIPVIAASSLPYWKKIAAVVALLFVFASCGDRRAPQQAGHVPDSAAVAPPPATVRDTTLLGGLGEAILIEPAKPAVPKIKEPEVVVVELEPVVQGGIMAPPEQPVVRVDTVMPQPVDTLTKPSAE